MKTEIRLLLVLSILVGSYDLYAETLPHYSDHRICSAYLLNSGKPHPASLASDPTATLEKHFDAVFELLDRNEEESLRVALDRICLRYGITPDSNDATKWLKRLRRNRAKNIANLKTYQAAGIFPRNATSHQITPVFVDSDGNACAVGHLMCEAGFEQKVKTIAEQTNLICLADADEDTIGTWIVESGLTHEEACLIQPGYWFDPSIQISYDELIKGESVEVGSLRLENFEMTIEGTAREMPHLNDLGLSIFVGPETFTEPFPGIYLPALTHWIYFGPQTPNVDGSFGIARAGDQLDVSVSYELTAINQFEIWESQMTVGFPSRSTAATVFGANYTLGANFQAEPPFGTISTSLSTFTSSGDTLGTVRAVASDPSKLTPLRADESVAYPPQESVHVEMTYRISEGAILTDFVHEFSLSEDRRVKGGDVDFNGVADIDDFRRFVRLSSIFLRPYLPEDEFVPYLYFDLDGDSVITPADGLAMMNATGVTAGDSNLDGRFDSQDLLLSFQSAAYENRQRTAKWQDGDWDFDSLFTTKDLVAAFMNGNYSAAATVVPEPASLGVLAWMCAIPIVRRRPSAMR